MFRAESLRLRPEITTRCETPRAVPRKRVPLNNLTITHRLSAARNVARRVSFVSKSVVFATITLVASICNHALAASTIVFNDMFDGSPTASVLQPATYPAPTDSSLASGSSAGYDIASNQLATGSALTTGASGKLTLSTAKSSNQIAEIESIFTHSPVSIASLGNGGEISLILTFTDTNGTNGVVTSGGSTSAAIYFGLYNSQASPGYAGTSAPDNNLEDALLNTDTNDATGGVASDIGYVSELFASGNSNGSRIDTRPAQSLGDNRDQDLVSDASSSSSSYTGGTTVGSKNASGDMYLTGGSVYTEDFTIELTGTNVESMTGQLYSGTSANVGNNADLLDTTNTVSTSTNSNFLTSSFDSLAVGYRSTDDATGGSGIEISQVEIETQVIAVPEPMSLSLLGLAGIGFLTRRTRRVPA